MAFGRMDASALNGKPLDLRGAFRGIQVREKQILEDETKLWTDAGCFAFRRGIEF